MAIGENSDISRGDLVGSIGSATARSRWGNGNSLLMERIWDRRAGDCGFDGRRQLRAGGRHRFAIGQGHRCRARRWFRFCPLTRPDRARRLCVRPDRPDSWSGRVPRRIVEAPRCRIGFAALLAPGKRKPAGHPPAAHGARPGRRPQTELGMLGSAIGIVEVPPRSRRTLPHIPGQQAGIVGEQRIQQRIPSGIGGVGRLLTGAARGCGNRCRRCARSPGTFGPPFAASYSDVHAAISADFDVSSRLGVRRPPPECL